MAAELGLRDTRALLGLVLRLSPAEAGARVAAVRDFGPRRGLTGDALDPVHPVVAAAVAAGAISERHARVVTDTIAALPHAVTDPLDAADSIEEFLTAQSALFTPQQLGVIAQRLRDTLDPDATLADSADHARRRELRLRPRPDGSARIEGTLTPWAYACARAVAVLDPLAAPAPDSDHDDPDHGGGGGGGGRDPRSAGQRYHDALQAACERLLRSATLPDSGGTPATCWSP